MAEKTATERKTEAAFSEVKQDEPEIVGKTRAKKGEAAADRQKTAIALSKARASGARIPENPKNAPLFPLPSAGQSDFVGKPKETEPLLGPSEQAVGTGKNLTLTNGEALDGHDEFKVDPGHGAPLVDADFHAGGLVGSTAKHLSPDTNS